MSDAETVALLVRQLEAYLRQNPQAIDSLDGIARWWLPRNEAFRPELIREALDVLVRRGTAAQRQQPDGSCLYAAAPASARVALIAVHGVGDQGPNETAREIARLLHRANENEYLPFREGTIDLQVEPAPAAPASTSARSAAPWFVQSPHVRKMASPGGAQAADIEFTASAIERAAPAGKSSRYASIRLTGERTGGRVALDVYELYWADLSRLSGVLAQVLGKFYQLLFHLATLGQKTVELAWFAGRGTPRASRALATVSFLQTMAEGLIGVVMPVLNLCFAAVVLPVMLLLASGTVRLAACGIAVAALAGAGVYRALHRGGMQTLGVWAPFLPVGAGVLAGVAAAWFLREKGVVLPALYFLALGGLLVIVWVLSSMLGERRSDSQVVRVFNSLPKATAFAGIALGAWLSWIGWRSCQDAADANERIAQAIAFAADGVFYSLQVGWTLLLLCGVLLTGGYLAIAWRARHDARGAEVKRALWTGHMGFFIPATLFLIVTIIIWKALVHLILKSIPPDTVYRPWLHEVLPGWLTAVVGDLPTRLRLPSAVPLAEYAQAILTDASGAFFNVLFVMIALAVILLVVGLLPSIVAETSPPQRATTNGSRRLGLWLDDAFAGAKLAGWLVLLGLVIVFPLGARPQVIDWIHDRHWEFLLGDSVATWIGGTIAGSVAVLTLFRRNIFGGLQKGLDIALDVDNWLRERPTTRNPRGLILLRFLALLRTVQAQGYDRIVIVSHSQGTVVCADLLRYLKAGHWARHGLATLQAVPIHLLTFGSPLRQLYGRRFPHLYGWADGPDPTALNVAVWVNGYRSGDYVGRYLWHADDADGRYDPGDPDTALADTADRHAEFCLGEGAHTHYFDETATPVGRLIDAFVLPR